MKIVFISAGDFPEGNAANSRLKAFGKGLIERGNEVIFTLVNASSFNNKVVNQVRKGQWETIPYCYFSLSAVRPQSLAGKVIDSAYSIINSLRFLVLNRRQIDILYFYSPNVYQTFHLVLMAKLLSIPAVFEQTELKSSFGGFKGIKAGLYKWMHRLGEKYSQYFCRHMFVISTSLYKHYEKYYSEERLTLLPIVIDFSRFEKIAKRKYSRELHVFGYLGSFGAKDGIDVIIKAFAMASKDNEHMQLRLMGYCRDEASVRALLAVHAVEDKVELSGRLSYDEIPQALSNCDVLLMNRSNTAYANMGFPTKLGEYLASRRPVISSDIRDVSHYLTHEEDVYLVTPDYPSVLASAMKLSFEEYDHFITIGEKGRQRAKALFDKEVQSDKLNSILQGILLSEL